MICNIPVEELIPFLPHRPPMVWISSVLEVGKDYEGLAGTCLIDLKKDSLYINNGEELRGSAAIEFTAQGFGYLKAAYQVIHKINNPPTKTYLTGVRSCQANFSDFELTKNKQLEVRISVLRELLPITYVRGEVSLPGSDVVLAAAEIQVYVD